MTPSRLSTAADSSSRTVIRSTPRRALAVSRREQGQVGGIVASVNGAAYIVAPAAGVWLYGHHPTVGFVTIGLLCAVVFALGWHQLDADEA